MQSMFDPRAFDKMIKEMNRADEQALRKLFSPRIKQSFLIEMMHKVMDTFGAELFNYYDLTMTNEKMITGESPSVKFEICRMIVGVHRSNSIFLSDTERVKNENDDKYKKELVDSVIMHIKLRNYCADFFRKKQIVIGDEFLFFPPLYKLFAMSMNALFILNEHNQEQTLRNFYSMIFNKALAALTLIEDNFLDNAYPICRLIIELYVKLLILELEPGLLEEHDKFSDYDLKKTCCGMDYPDEFKEKFKNRKNQNEKSRIDFLHYGWLDILDDYHDIVKQNPYSINGIIDYLNEKVDYGYDFQNIKFYYKMCHTYTHGNVGISRYPLLHYFELSLILGITLPRTYELLCKHTNVDGSIGGINIIPSLVQDIEKVYQQHSIRSTENFDAYYNFKK